MSTLFLRTPGFASGSPSGLRHAAFGISCAPPATGSSTPKARMAARCSKMYFFIDPPRGIAIAGEVLLAKRRIGRIRCEPGKNLSPTSLCVFVCGETCLPIFVKANVVGRKVREDRSPEFQNVDGAEILVQHLAVSIEQYRVRHGRLPCGVEGCLQCGGVVRSEKQIAAGGVLLLEH